MYGRIDVVFFPPILMPGNEGFSEILDAQPVAPMESDAAVERALTALQAQIAKDMPEGTM